ncbi:MAG: hypothetical protein EZS28_007545 [Streblomastix strix]|uniref:DDE-1 domain-containing protein n=1 Tax=Streblomastix strix TaxID=222440 RepID=A0A5J4WPY7_9EUKA|nr:MAG: hypothetical protein EZS28_007545 [Streblomastix strix]
MLRGRVQRRHGPFNNLASWKIEKLLEGWVPELDRRESAAVQATFQHKSLSQLVRDTVAFMKSLKFHLLPSTIFCEICQCPELLFSQLMKEQLVEKKKVGKQSHMLTDEQENDLIMYLTMKWFEGQPFQLADMGRVVWTLFQRDVSRMFVDYFAKRHPDEIEIVRTSPREYRHMRLQYEDVQTYISFLKENVHGVLAVLISNVDESSVWALSDGGVKHFLVPASIAQDVSSYGVDRAEGRISVCADIILSGECIKPLIITKGDVTDEDLLLQSIVQGKQAVVYSSGTGNLNSDLFVRWLKECYFPDLDAKRVILKQRNALAIPLTENCGIHRTDQVKKLLEQQNVMIISFSANSTQFLQPIDCLSFSVLKRAINQSRAANTKFTPSQGVLDAFDALQKSKSIKTTQAALKNKPKNQRQQQNRRKHQPQIHKQRLQDQKLVIIQTQHEMKHISRSYPRLIPKPIAQQVVKKQAPKAQPKDFVKQQQTAKKQRKKPVEPNRIANKQQKYAKKRRTHNQIKSQLNQEEREFRNLEQSLEKEFSLEMMEQEQLLTRFQRFESEPVRYDLLSQLIEDKRAHYAGEAVKYISGTETTSPTVEFFINHITSPEDCEAFMERVYQHENGRLFKCVFDFGTAIYQSEYMIDPNTVARDLREVLCPRRIRYKPYKTIALSKY